MTNSILNSLPSQEPCIGGSSSCDGATGVGGASSNINPLVTRTPPSNPPATVSTVEDFVNPRLGGFDGGFSIGFTGTWNQQFKSLIKKLETAKTEAQNRQSGGKVILGSTEVYLDQCGNKIGNTYWRYKFYGFGVVFFLNDNPNNVQQIRAIYGAEALILNPLPVLHSRVLEFFRSLGLTVTSETITRCDMQVMLDVPVSEFTDLISNRHAIKKSRKSAFYLRSDMPETYQAGDSDNVQICIYDKRAEMKGMAPEKRILTIENCIGNYWWKSKRPITRVEYRLGRESLRCFGVNSVVDLLKRERGIVDRITQDWFRLLEKPKVRGKENSMKIHPLWERVRTLFFEYFSGSEIRNVTYRKPQPVECDPTTLLRQAEGCIAKAMAYQRGEQKSSADVVEYVKGIVEDSKDTILQKVNQHVDERRIINGVVLGGTEQQNIPTVDS